MNFDTGLREATILSKGTARAAVWAPTYTYTSGSVV